jgi:pyruvate formate lyase activating enzyme
MNPANQSEITGRVLNIQRYCSHDGPGIRTTVFLKGCSLRCKWCSNPESIKPKPELSFGPETCLGANECGACLKAPFREGAFYVVDGPDDRVRVNWDLASDVDQTLADLCPTDAIEMFGKVMTAEEVLDEVERDASFYRQSGGGMSLSRCWRGRTSAASTPPSRLRATCPGSSWSGCCRTSTPCCTTSS